LNVWETSGAAEGVFSTPSEAVIRRAFWLRCQQRRNAPQKPKTWRRVYTWGFDLGNGLVHRH